MLIYVYHHCMFLKGMVSTGFRLDQSHTSQNKVKYWNVVLSRFCWWMQLMYGKSAVYLKNALVSVLQMMAYLWFHIYNIVFHDTPATTLSSIHHWCERTSEVGWQSGYIPRSECGKSTKLKIIKNHFSCLNLLDKLSMLGRSFHLCLSNRRYTGVKVWSETSIDDCSWLTVAECTDHHLCHAWIESEQI